MPTAGDASREPSREPDFADAVTIRVDRSTLRAFLGDLHGYVPLHPLIASIEEMEPSPGLPLARRYRVVDRIPVGPFTLKTVYVAVLEPVSDTEIHGHAWQWPNVRLHTIYELTEMPGAEATRLEERVYVDAPFGLKRFVTRQASRSHTATLRRMKSLLERS